MSSRQRIKSGTKRVNPTPYPSRFDKGLSTREFVARTLYNNIDTGRPTEFAQTLPPKELARRIYASFLTVDDFQHDYSISNLFPDSKLYV